MEPQRVQRIRRYLTQRFSVIAILTSVLVANGGSGSLFLPVLVVLVTVSAYVLVDWLGVVHLGRTGSFVGMALATLVAMATLVVSVYRDFQSVQLLAVASLLIYPQCVLFYQKKSLRVYEQLSIFLLLQMIVAALINDNYIYGLLMVPILCLWVSALLLFARYAALVDASPDIDQPVPLLYQLIYERFAASLRAQPPKPIAASIAQVQPNLLTVHRKQTGWTTGTMALGALAFGGAVFYLLPRTQYNEIVSFQVREVGIADQVTVGKFGSILSDPTPVMRVQFSNADGTTYPVFYPPYLRVGVVGQYSPPRNAYDPGVWVSQRSPNGSEPPPPASSNPLRDLVQVEVQFKKGIRRHLVSVPPVTDFPAKLEYRHDELAFATLVQYELHQSNLQSYHFVTAGFADHRQLGIFADYDERSRLDATGGLPPMPAADRMRMEILRSLKIQPTDRYAAAKAFEEHLKHSGEYRYSLDMQPPFDPDIDPIEDFLVNQKAGLCQNYAAGLVTWLRQTDIPSRIVIGYLPVDFNRMGQHFIVKQSDAHAWVEARFARHELLGTNLEPLLDDAPYYWVQLDATPPGDHPERMIVQNRRSLEFAEKIWDNYVASSQMLKQSGLYENVSGSGKEMASWLMSEWQLLNGTISGSLFRNRTIGFQWQLAVGVFVLGVAALGLWQLLIWLPRLAPGLSRRFGLRQRATNSIQLTFFARYVDLLESLRLYRHPWETIEDYTNRARGQLDHPTGPSASEVDRAVKFLTDWYYALRFGDRRDLSANARQQLEQHLQVVQRAVRAGKS
ncbi:MAG: DUF3488 domain-containing protein [Pirellulaceae bacterium]|nr:DUF3488 domain-containing protein [Pirellulaceae bacterium]